MGFGVGFGSIFVGVWLAVGCRVARGGGSHFWSIPVVLGVGFLLFFCFTLLQTYNVKYLLEYFPRMQTNVEK